MKIGCRCAQVQAKTISYLRINEKGLHQKQQMREYFIWPEADVDLHIFGKKRKKIIVELTCDSEFKKD